jgi:hypothetical protein
LAQVVLVLAPQLLVQMALILYLVQLHLQEAVEGLVIQELLE